MKRSGLLWFLLGATLLAAAPTASAAPAAETLYDLDGRPRALAEYTGRGKWLVVMVWASDCAVCNKEVHEMVAFHKAHRARDATVLGISVDGPGRKADALAFIQRHAVDFPNLIDDGRAFANIYLRETGRAWFGGTPMNLIYGPSGEFVARHIGALTQADIEAFIAQQSARPAVAH